MTLRVLVVERAPRLRSASATWPPSCTTIAMARYGSAATKPALHRCKTNHKTRNVVCLELEQHVEHVEKLCPFARCLYCLLSTQVCCFPSWPDLQFLLANHAPIGKSQTERITFRSPQEHSNLACTEELLICVLFQIVAKYVIQKGGQLGEECVEAPVFSEVRHDHRPHRQRLHNLPPGDLVTLKHNKKAVIFRQANEQ